MGRRLPAAVGGPLLLVGVQDRVRTGRAEMPEAEMREVERVRVERLAAPALAAGVVRLHGGRMMLALATRTFALAPMAGAATSTTAAGVWMCIATSTAIVA
jgi:hypothetical protein